MDKSSSTEIKISRLQQLMQISVIFLCLSLPICALLFINSLPRIAKSMQTNLSNKVSSISINSDKICASLEKLADKMEQVPAEKKQRILTAVNRIVAQVQLLQNQGGSES